MQAYLRHVFPESLAFCTLYLDISCMNTYTAHCHWVGDLGLWC